jgi:hypothetical protein
VKKITTAKKNRIKIKSEKTEKGQKEAMAARRIL